MDERESVNLQVDHHGQSAVSTQHDQTVITTTPARQSALSHKDPTAKYH
jgi:hypothetical protein